MAITALFFFSMAASFLIGVLVTLKWMKPFKSEKDHKNLYKKHKDISNWLKSELKFLENPKVDKYRIDENKVKLLKLIISKLETKK